MNIATNMLRATRQAGLTLIELMVALAIGLFLMLGLVYMMSDTSRSFRIQDDYARMQENAVTSLRYIGDSLRQAGFYGVLARTTALTPRLDATTLVVNPDCGNTLTTTVPIFGYTDVTDANAVVNCIQNANFQPGPILITRLSTGQPIPTGAVGTGSNWPTLFVQSDAGYGNVFLGKDYAAIAAAGMHKRDSNNNVLPIFPYQMHVYYIRPCSRPTGPAETCTATDDGGNPVPTLVRRELQGDASTNALGVPVANVAMVERPLAEGIERIHLLYGLDSLPLPNGDGVADRFVTDPLSIAADGWSRVVAVRVTLLVRSLTTVPGYDDSTKTYDLDGDGTYNAAVDFRCTNATLCAYKRAVFSQVIQVRNLAFRRGA